MVEDGCVERTVEDQRHSANHGVVTADDAADTVRDRRIEAEKIAQAKPDETTSP
jgi:hypothetical protein